MSSSLLNDLIELTEHHKKNCSLYHKYTEMLFPTSKEVTKLSELPWLPVRAFKHFDLKTVPDEDVFKTMHSSGTGGLQSRIFLDQETAKMQQTKLIEVFQRQFGASRYPMLVIDTVSTVKNRNIFSARTAAINGFSIFSRGRVFALDDNLKIDLEKIQQFIDEHSGKTIFIFGFTFIVWQNFIQEVARLGLKLDLSNSFLLHGGGWKKLENEKVNNGHFKAMIEDTIGCKRIHNYYGMIEQTGSIYMECEYGALHAAEGSDVIIRNLKDFAVLDYSQKGLIHLFSSIQRSYPGHSILTEDVGFTFPPDSCLCGRPGTILKIDGRLEQAEVRGCSDAVSR